MKEQIVNIKPEYKKLALQAIGKITNYPENEDITSILFFDNGYVHVYFKDNTRVVFYLEHAFTDTIE